MKRNIMLIVVLGLVLYGGVSVLGLWMSSDENAVGYSTERMVEAAYRAHVPTTYTPSVAGNSAVAVPMSAGQGTPFRHTYVPAANYTVSTPVLNGGSYASQGLMLTSQQRQQSYGGSATGTSVTRTSAGSGASYAMGGYGSSTSALGGYSSGGIYSSGNTYSTAAGGGISVHGNMTSTFSPSVYASAPAPYASFNNKFNPETILASCDKDATEAEISYGTFLSAEDMLDIALGNRVRRRENGRGDETGSGTITEGDKPPTISPIGDGTLFLLLLVLGYISKIWISNRKHQADMN